MKSILMSIKPKWVKKIASGEKTVEVRKSAPKCETPFKVYMYATKEGRGRDLRLHINDEKGRKDVGATTWWRDGKNVLTVNEHLSAYRFNSYLAEGKVVGEFVCDYVRPFEVQSPAYWYLMNKAILEQACLTKEELHDYIGAGNLAHGLHISDLKIYDKPKELSEFRVKNKIDIGWDIKTVPLFRPPQSWCYVEEL